MNKKRRDGIQKVAQDLITCKDMLQNYLDEEEEYYDNMPESLQGSMRGTDAEEAIDTIEEVIESLDTVIDQLENL